MLFALGLRSTPFEAADSGPRTGPKAAKAGTLNPPPRAPEALATASSAAAPCRLAFLQLRSRDLAVRVSRGGEQVGGVKEGALFVVKDLSEENEERFSRHG